MGRNMTRREVTACYGLLTCATPVTKVIDRINAIQPFLRESSSLKPCNMAGVELPRCAPQCAATTSTSKVPGTGVGKSPSFAGGVNLLVGR
jgi:hypothetical protein